MYCVLACVCLLVFICYYLFVDEEEEKRSRQYLISGHPFRSVPGMPTLTAD
jgi:hypothetical protein